MNFEDFGNSLLEFQFEEFKTDLILGITQNQNPRPPNILRTHARINIDKFL